MFCVDWSVDDLLARLDYVAENHFSYNSDEFWLLGTPSSRSS